MAINLLHFSSVLLIFIGVFFMIASYEEHTQDKKTSQRFMRASTFLFLVAALLMGVE